MEKHIKKSVYAGVAIAALSVVVSNASLAQQPKNIELSIDNENLRLETSAKSVSEVLEDIGYKFVDGSQINYSLESQVKDKMKIDINTEKKINLSNGGHLLKVSSFADTVKELLEEENITLDENDIVSPSLSTSLKEVKSVSVDYYKEKESKKTEPIKFEVKNTPTMELTWGEKKVATKGVNGEKTITYVKTLKNGQVLESEKVSEEVTKKPVDKEILIGQKLVEKKVVKNKTVRQNDSSLYKGKTKVAESGQDGLIKKTYKYDGKTKTLVDTETIREAKDRIIKVGTKARPVVKKKPVVKRTVVKRKPVIAKTSSSRSSSIYSLGDLRFQGVIRWGGFKYTYYSQSVLPGRGLRIPGRHINAGGFVADANGYIVLANSRPKGTVLPTPFGYKGKVYDRGTYGNHLDVYTR